MNKTILIVDDEADIRNLVQGILQDEGYATLLAENSQACYDQISKGKVDLIVLDIWLQGSEDDGLEILAKVKEGHPDIPIIMISGHGTVETAVAAIKQGAYDFIEKPFKADRLLLMAQRALENAELRLENTRLKRQSQGKVLELVGDSPFSKNLNDIIKRVAPTNSRVFLKGEAGTGKDIVGRLIHAQSERSDMPFVILNCATLEPHRFEDSLFGVHDDGAPQNNRIGVFEKADGGTLLLDQVSDMPIETQAKIVRVLQEQRFQKPGSNSDVHVDVRIMASSNISLEDAIESGMFREDLYYRLNVMSVDLVPLRQRAQDIPALVGHFVETLSHEYGLPQRAFNSGAMDVLLKCSWPGNIRQLRNVIEWVMIMHARSVDGGFDVEHLPPDISGLRVPPSLELGDGGHVLQSGLVDLPLREARDSFEQDYLLAQLGRFDGNISKTAQFIGMERSALHRKLKTIKDRNGDKNTDKADVVPIMDTSLNKKTGASS